MGKSFRKSGIDCLGNVQQGTHVCCIYETAEHLIELLVPYFKAGLENNEYCLWVTSETFSVADAESAMRKAMPDFDEHLKARRMEILPHTQWCLKFGLLKRGFSFDGVMNHWVVTVENEMQRGFDGLRLSGNITWLPRKWIPKVCEAEAVADSFIKRLPVIAICTYNRAKLDVRHMMEIGSHHERCLVETDGEWAAVLMAPSREMEQTVMAGEEKFRTLFNGAADAIFLASLPAENVPGLFVEVNEPLLKRLGYTRSELCMLPCSDIEVPEHAGRAAEAIALLRDVGEATYETEHVAKSGKRIPVEIHSHIVADGSIPLVLSIARDITERKKVNEAAIARLRHQAVHDPLTGLLNRRSMEEILAKAQEMARNGTPSVLLYIDVDNFKTINDTLGHQAGDDMLVALSGCMLHELRAEDILARPGGDEFTALLTDTDPVAALAVAERLKEAVNSCRQEINGKECPVCVSIGLAAIDGDIDPSEAVARADVAMYAAKEQGRNRIVVAD